MSLLDLRNASLQIQVDKELWPFQTVIFRSQHFCLMWLWFGLNVAPLIMKSVIDTIISQDHMIKSATSVYVDDIFINESLVPASCVQLHLFGLWFGFQGSGATERRTRVLSLQVWEKDRLTRWYVFSLCGEICWSLPHMCMDQGGSCIY